MASNRLQPTESLLHRSSEQTTQRNREQGTKGKRGKVEPAGQSGEPPIPLPDAPCPDVRPPRCRCPAGSGAQPRSGARRTAALGVRRAPPAGAGGGASAGAPGRASGERGPAARRGVAGVAPTWPGYLETGPGHWAAVQPSPGACTGMGGPRSSAPAAGGRGVQRLAPASPGQLGHLCPGGGRPLLWPLDGGLPRAVGERGSPWEPDP